MKRAPERQALLHEKMILDDLAKFSPEDWIPKRLRDLGDYQTALPRIAKDQTAATEIENILPKLPTRHDLYNADARKLKFIKDNSVHLGTR
jgi:hypothetical protein